MHKFVKIQVKQEMHTLKEGATMLQHRPANIPPPPIVTHIKEEATTFFYPHSNPIDNAAAAAAAAAAAGLIDPHSRDLHNALVASINNNVAAHNGTLTSAAVAAHTQLAKHQQQQQQQQQSNTPQNQVTQQQQQHQQNSTQQQSQQATLALLNSNNATNGTTNTSGAITTVATLNGTSIKSTSSGRSTPNNGSVNGGSNATDPAPGKLFVGGLSWQTSSEKLKEYFNMFGTVTDVLIMKDPVTQVRLK